MNKVEALVEETREDDPRLRLPILCLDFDGVIHSYEKGWQGGEIYGEVTDGFWEWAEEAQKHFRLVVYSSRSCDEGQLNAMIQWVMDKRNAYFEAQGVDPATQPALIFEFAFEKPPAFLTIDDRAVTFTGDWSKLPPVMLKQFKPWNWSPAD